MLSGQKSIEAAMYDDDHDALAAEYVLGTLSAAEREQAVQLLAQDAGFAKTVRLWEHRLGELNVMVEAIEPPSDVWERIKTGIDDTERRNQAASEALELAGTQSEPVDAVSPTSPQIETSSEPSFQTVPDLLADRAQSSADSTASDLASSGSAAESDDRLARSTTPQSTTGVQTATGVQT